jgi:hypothetical protein
MMNIVGPKKNVMHSDPEKVDDFNIRQTANSCKAVYRRAT